VNQKRIDELSELLYQECFEMLDAEPNIDGMTAGAIATEVQEAFLAQFLILN
jgi:hypothetical protein